MKFGKKVLLGLIAFILLMTVSYTVIFCIKGSYPVEIYMALIPTCITELIILYKIKMKDVGENSADEATNRNATIEAIEKKEGETDGS